MLATDLSCLSAQIAAIAPVRRIGRVAGVSGGIIKVRGLTQCARIGDQLRLTRQNGDQIGGEGDL